MSPRALLCRDPRNLQKFIKLQTLILDKNGITVRFASLSAVPHSATLRAGSHGLSSDEVPLDAEYEQQ